MQDTRLYEQILGLTAPWFVKSVALKVAEHRVDLEVEHGTEALWVCPECGQSCRLYDHAEVRSWRHLDTCQFQTYLHSRIPRVECPEHGIRNVEVPWGQRGSRFTMLMECWIIRLLEQCQNIQGACALAGITWDQGFGVMQRAVQRGQARKAAAPIRYLGVDEKAFRKGRHFVTIVSDLEQGAVQYVAEHHRTESLAGYYQQLSPTHLAAIEAVAMDMYEPYILATMTHVPQAADKIVFDRFHIMKNLNEALDRVRQQENEDLSRQRDQRLAKTRMLWLWAEEHLPEKYRARFAALKDQDLRTAKAWAMKENLRHLWEQSTPRVAQAFFNKWDHWVQRSGLKPLMRVAKTLRQKLPQIINYCKHPLTSAGCEGLNSKITTIKFRAAGFRNLENFKNAILFYCGKLDLYPR